MGTLFSALDIARSGLQVAQGQMDIAGHNIANVNKEGFTRQRVELLTRRPLDRPFGKIGRGVDIGTVRRLRDVFLDRLYRNTTPGLGNSQFTSDFLGRIEDVFLEPGENGLSNRYSLFFDALNEFTTNVESLPVRQSVVTEAQTLSGLFNETAARLFDIRTNANNEIIGFVPEINSIAQRIAFLNNQIRRSEADGQPANDLRDDRDVLLDKLSNFTNVFTRERTDGQIDVQVSGEVLVNGNRSRDIEAVRVAALDPERDDLVELRFVDDGMLFAPRDGEVFAAFQVRDVTLVDVDARLDTMAGTLIQQINQIHSQGRGIVNMSGTVSTTNPAVDAVTPLDTAGLPFPVSSGSFDVTIYDNTGAVSATSTITITAGATTLTSLAADLNAISPDFSATVTANNTLDLTAAPGFTFAFANDTSGALPALGANGLFTGFDARTMGVNLDIASNPALLSSAFDPDPLATGDNSAALALADVQNGKFLDNNNSTILGFYETSIVQLGVQARSNLEELEVERTFVEGFERRRKEISGVSVDEEVTFMIQFQRAFEASARVVTVTDRMLESLLSMAL